MISFFESKALVTDPDGTAAFLVLDNLKNKKGMSFITLNGSFMDFYNRITDKRKFFESIDDNEVKRSFIEEIKENVDKWLDVVVSLYPYYMNTFMANTISNGSKKRLYRILADSVLTCRENPDFFIYLTNAFDRKDWEKAKVGSETLMITKLSLLSSVNKKIENSIDVADNKKRQSLLMDALFRKDKEVQNYMDSADEAQAQKLYSILKGIPGIETERLTVKHTIINKFSNHDEILGEKQNQEIDRKKIIPTGLLCTQAMLDAKKQELDHIMNVEIPENSREIGTARALGDLRENAEYQYGKDKQKNLNFLMNKLTDEVSAAQVILPENVDLQYVSFGTKVTFRDNKTKKDVCYTLFGPWESDPARNILNFKAPLGQAIYNMEVGENRKFNINGIDYDYTVKTIELADF
jgi:transcription elongation GreA/GreB family factor